MKSKLPAFDVLVDMARNHPQRLEELRLSLTGELIANCDDDRRRRRLEGLQFQVDLEREKARTPLAACIKISEMMANSLAELHRSMVTPLVEEQDARHVQSAKVLAFPKTAFKLGKPSS